MWAVTADVERFDEALEWFLGRTILTDEQRLAIPASARSRAFWIAGVAQLDIVQDVFGEIERSLEKGEPFEGFKKRVRDKLTKAWGRDDPARIETIFRNAVQSSYNAGRWAQMTEPSVAKFRPYFMYDAILDERTTELCRGLNGTILPHDDPFWDTHCPPLHHRCRAGIRNLRASEAERRGITQAPPAERPPEGWGLSPRVAREWRPEAGSRDPELLAALERKRPPEPPPPTPWKTFGEVPQGRIPPQPRYDEQAAQRRAQEVAKRLSPGEREIVRIFSDEDFSEIRAALRMSQEEWERLYPSRTDYRRLRGMAATMRDAITAYGGTPGGPAKIFRGIGLTRAPLEHFVNADYVVADTISSTSRHVRKAVEFALEGDGDVGVVFLLRNRSSGNTLPIEAMSEHPHEAEILVGPGKRYRVIKAERTQVRGKDLLILHTEELGPDAIITSDRVVRLQR